MDRRWGRYSLTRLPPTVTVRASLIPHYVKTYQDSCKYVFTYHRELDGILILQITMWIERLSLSVINRQEKLATRICVFLKITKTFVCLFIS